MSSVKWCTFNIQTVIECVEEITNELKDFRSDENFESVINSAKEMARHIRCISSCYRNSKKKNVWLWGEWWTNQ
jgi:hypothetical protein